MAKHDPVDYEAMSRAIEEGNYTVRETTPDPETFNPQYDAWTCKRGEMVGDGCYCDCFYDVKTCDFARLKEGND